MQQSYSIDLLDHAIGIGGPGPLGLPSWVCNWEQLQSTGMAFFDIQRLQWPRAPIPPYH